MLLALLRVAKGKTVEDPADTSFHILDPMDKPLTLKEKIAKYIINPMNPYKVALDMLISFLYLLVYFMDPYIFAF